MRFKFLCFLLSLSCCFTAYAQHDSLTAKDKGVLSPVDPNTVNPFMSGSAINANRQKLLADSIAMSYLIPDSSRGNQLINSIMKSSSANFFSLQPTHLIKTAKRRQGMLRSSRAPWMIIIVTGLLIYTGLLTFFSGDDVKKSFQSFYHRHSLTQTDKEGGLINSRAFIALFILFCLTLGIVLFQIIQYYNYSVVYTVNGPQLFIYLSAAICLLAAVKFILLKFIGFVFDIGSVISEYIAVLNLTCFNMAFVLLSVAVCFTLLSSQFIPGLLIFTAGMTAAIFLWQYLRNSLNIISDFRFHKFYLFVYLCALEICPVLILIKALNI
jgi:hypothetical protein